MRILITGSNGQLESEIKELAANYKKADFIFKDLLKIRLFVNFKQTSSKHEIKLFFFKIVQ